MAWGTSLLCAACASPSACSSCAAGYSRTSSQTCAICPVNTWSAVGDNTCHVRRLRFCCLFTRERVLVQHCPAGSNTTSAGSTSVLDCVVHRVSSSTGGTHHHASSSSTAHPQPHHSSSSTAHAQHSSSGGSSHHSSSSSSSSSASNQPHPSSSSGGAAPSGSSSSSGHSGAAGSFTVTAQSDSFVVYAGSSAVFTVTISERPSSSVTLQLTLHSSLPSAQLSLSPTALVFDSTAPLAQTFTITASTMAPAASASIAYSLSGADAAEFAAPADTQLTIAAAQATENGTPTALQVLQGVYPPSVPLAGGIAITMLGSQLGGSLLVLSASG